VVIIDCGLVFANTQPFLHFAWTELVKYMHVGLESMYNFPQFTKKCFIISFVFKKNVRYPVWTCRDPISLILGTR